jgi:arsenate reductase
VSAELVLWFNPACSKCREARRIVEERGFTPSLRLYLEDPPRREELTHILSGLEGPAASIVRDQDRERLGLSNASSTDAVIDAIEREPGALERPILVCGDRAIVARPPERVLDLLVPRAATVP